MGVELQKLPTPTLPAVYIQPTAIHAMREGWVVSKRDCEHCGTLFSLSFSFSHLFFFHFKSLFPFFSYLFSLLLLGCATTLAFWCASCRSCRKCAAQSARSVRTCCRQCKSSDAQRMGKLSWRAQMHPQHRSTRLNSRRPYRHSVAARKQGVACCCRWNGQKSPVQRSWVGGWVQSCML